MVLENNTDSLKKRIFNDGDDASTARNSQILRYINLRNRKHQVENTTAWLCIHLTRQCIQTALQS